VVTKPERERHPIRREGCRDHENPVAVNVRDGSHLEHRRLKSREHRPRAPDGERKASVDANGPKEERTTQRSFSGNGRAEDLLAVLLCLHSTVRGLGQPVLIYLHQLIVGGYRPLAAALERGRRYFAATGRRKPPSTFATSRIFFQRAGRHGILGNVESWCTYLKGRNLTSQYLTQTTVLARVAVAARLFHPDVKVLAADSSITVERRYQQERPAPRCSRGTRGI
jgi:hypothetical protein